MKDASPIFTKRFESYIWIRPEGRGTFLESSIIKDLVGSSAEGGISNFIIDLEACPGMDSTFMGMLAGLGIGFRKNKKGEISIVGTTKKTRASLKELGLQYLMAIEPTDAPWLGKMDEARGNLVLLDQKSEIDREAHVLECHEDLCTADEGNLHRFRTVLDMMGSKIAPKASPRQKSSD
ncbi:STAS domain-containing protein [bacterium]|nr:STAS domain-containing protein [Akkermansiaceae bacterium]MDA7875416.1 STAS domain-containing protein [Akkermansiaceae bacterium]MDC0272927.1 STAS domain-containing protein [bacterium]